MEQIYTFVIMKRVLFIGNPQSVHDLKWIEYLNRSSDVEAFISFKNKLSFAENNYFNSNGIKIGPIFNDFSFFNWIKNYRTYRLFKKFVNEFNINCLHIFVGTSQVIMPSFLKLPIVLTTRGTDVNFTLTQLSKSRELKGKLLFKIMENAYKRVDQITCTSNTQIRALNNAVPSLKKKPILVRTGVDLEGVMNSQAGKLSSDSKRENTVFFIRNIHKNYDPLFSVEGVVKLEKNLIDKTHFIFMMGRNYTVPLYKEMKNILETNNISHSFIEPVPNDEVWKLIKLADLIVMNPLSDGTPNSAIEVMGAKRKLIMGYCDYDNDLFNESTTVFLSKRDSSELAEKISYQLSNDNTELLESAFKTVWEKGRQSSEMQKILNLYSCLLS